MVEAHFALLLHDYRMSDDPVRAYGDFRSRCANTEYEYLFWNWNSNIDGGETQRAWELNHQPPPALPPNLPAVPLTLAESTSPIAAAGNRQEEGGDQPGEEDEGTGLIPPTKAHGRSGITAGA